MHRSAGLLGVALTDEGSAEIASRSRGTPRIANRLLRRVRDYAQVRADGVVTLPVAQAALELYEVDEPGLDRLDRAVLDALCRRFGGGPVGVSTLAVAVGEERETVEEVAEPFLVRNGLLARTPRGRIATAAAWQHLGLTPPAGSRRPGTPPSSTSVGQTAAVRMALWSAHHPRLHCPSAGPGLHAAPDPSWPFPGGTLGEALLWWNSRPCCGSSGSCRSSGS